jgi:hypothetical protein
MDYDLLKKQIRHAILNLAVPLISPYDASKMAQAAVDVIVRKNDLVDVLAAGKYIARRDSEALRLLSE